LPEHGVDEGGFAVVDVGDDSDVANVLAHGACVIRLVRHRADLRAGS
jgi:hypothetical protein